MMSLSHPRDSGPPDATEAAIATDDGIASTIVQCFRARLANKQVLRCSAVLDFLDFVTSFLLRSIRVIRAHSSNGLQKN